MADNKLLLFIFAIIILSNCVNAYDYSVNLNEFDTLHDTYDLHLESSIGNNTIYIYYFEDSNYTINTNVLSSNITEFYFNNTNDSCDVTVNINFTAQSEDQIYYMYINSTQSNNNIAKTFFFNVTPEAALEPVWYDIDIGEYEWVVCNNQLPGVFNKVVTVAGTVGQVINVTSNESWITHPDNVTIGNLEYVNVEIIGNVPSLDIGRYNRTVYFNGVNYSHNVKFFMDVKDCGIVTRYKQYIEECDSKYDKGTLDYIFCAIEARQKYDDEWLREYAQRNRTEIVTRQINITKEIPVEVMKINGMTASEIITTAAKEAATKAITEIMESIVQPLRASNTELQNKVVILESEKESMNNKLLNIPTEVNKTATSLFNHAWEKEKKKNSWKTWFFWIVLLGGSTIFLITLYKKNNLY